MSTKLETLVDWAAGLLGQLEPSARNQLARSLGQALRRSQQERVIAQQNPDGTKYAPRKQRNLRGKQGRVKRKLRMFQKLPAAKFLKVQADSNTISIGFTGRIARIARIHQYGLQDRPERDAPAIKYEQRRLIGLSADNLNLIRDELLKHITA